MHQGSYEKITKSVKIKENGNNYQTVNFNMYKEEITYKQLDFEIRQKLIKGYNLYSTYQSGKITIKDKNNGNKTFDLSKKLSQDQMEETLNTDNIQSIEIELNS